jgi:hypothetical protein
MNSNLYTEEFRNFKYLKSSPEQVVYYKDTARQLNLVQPWAQTNDPKFVWPCRLEFIEQLFDLKDDIVYIVEPGNLYPIEHRKHSYDYEDARLHIIENPVVVRGNPYMHPERLRVILTEDDIPEISDFEKNRYFFVCSKNNNPTPVLKVSDIGLIPTNNFNYVSVFYSYEWSKKYSMAITQFLRKENDAISTISKMF